MHNVGVTRYMARRKKYLPGSLFTRKDRPFLYIKMFGKQYSTGLHDNPTNRKKAEEIMWHLYEQHLLGKDMIKAKDEEKYYTMEELFEEFILHLTNQKKRAEKTLHSYRYAFNTVVQGNY